MLRGWHWIVIAVGLASLASAAGGPSPPPVGGTPPPAPSRKPLGRSLLDARGLRKRLDEEPELAEALLAFAERKGWGEEHLDYFVAVVGNIESGFDPQAVNPYTRATGLIQFMPSTAKALGTTVEALATMTATEQMPFVEKFFAGRKLENPRDIYPAIFYPAIIGKPDSFVLFRKGEKGYDQNRGLDKNNDDVLTAGDVRASADNAVFSLRQKARILV